MVVFSVDEYLRSLFDDIENNYLLQDDRVEAELTEEKMQAWLDSLTEDERMELEIKTELAEKRIRERRNKRQRS